MSTLRTFNLQHPESNNNNIQLAEGGGVSVTAGILTATNVSSTNVTTTEVTATNGTFSGNLSIGGVLSYEDVTNIDSIGIITARTGIVVSAGHINLPTGYSLNWSDTHERIEQSDAKIKFFTNNTEKLTLSGGNVGIGTDNPADKLSIYAAPNSLVFGAKDTTRGNHIFQLLANNPAGDGELRLYKNSGSGTHEKTVEIKSTGNSYLTGGNLGIGNASPTYELEVASSDTTTLNITAGGNTNISRLFFSDGDAVARGYLNYNHNGDNLIIGAAGAEKLRISSDGTVFINGDGTGGRIYAASSKLYLQSGNGRQSFNIADMAAGSSATHEFNSSGNLSLAGGISAKDYVNLTDTDTSARLNVNTDLSGNYTGWKEKGVAAGSMSQASIDSKTPTLNDFTYPNNSNGMLIWSTSKIGFAAGGESPQYGTGVQMLFDSGGLMLGGNRAFDRTSSTSTSTNWNLKLNTAGSAVFKGQIEADPFLLDANDSWMKSTYGAISNSHVSSLNNLMIGQNMRGWVGTRDGGSATNNYYNVVTHGGIGYCGTEYCYQGITKFYNNTGGSTANATFTPYERVRLTSSRFTSASGFHFSSNSSTNNSLPNPYNIGDISSNNVAYPHTPGIYMVFASSPCDNTWRTLFTSINDSTFVFEGISGDASSKRNFKVIGNPTSPSYGINRLLEDYNHGAWNTGDIEFRLDGTHPNWNLQVKTTSYYNSSNNAGIRFMLFVYY